MSDTTTAYLVSVGIIGAGAIWIDAGTTLCIAIGVPTIVVGLISLLAELRLRCTYGSISALNLLSFSAVQRT